MRRHLVRTLLPLLPLLLILACSSAPKTPVEVFETKNQATNYVKLADSLVAKGQYDSASTYYRQAIDTYASVDWLEGVSTARSSLGRLWLAWGDLDAAKEEFAKADDYARLSGSGRAVALAATGLGEVSFRRGDQETALADFERAVTAAAGDEPSLAVALHDRAGASYALGKKAEARADLEKSVAINTKLKRWSELASNRYLLASFLAREDDAEGAAKAAGEALANDKRAENAAGVVADLSLLARLAETAGKKDDAYWYWRRAFDAALGANLAVSARQALEALVVASPGVGREAEVPGWQSYLDRLSKTGTGK